MGTSGQNFVLVESNYSKIIGLLRLEAKDFFDSKEYEFLHGHADDLPGVMSAAFARFLTRLTHFESPEKLSQYLCVLEKFANWHDSEVDNLLRDEVFEAMSLDPVGSENLRKLMSGRLLEMYVDWLSQPY